MRKKTTTLLLILLTIALAWAPAEASVVVDDDDREGLQADFLTINVGYLGGPYYQKKVFTLDELASLGQITAVYSYIDKMPSVCLDNAKGSPLSAIIQAAGIDLNSVERFYFYTNDKKEGYYTDFTKRVLLEKPRYYYPNLVFRYYEPDYAPDEYDERAAESAVPVPAMMAVSDYWQRHLDKERDDFGKIDYSKQRTLTRFRLLFGQTDTLERNASRSAKWIHSINVMLGGSPTITTDVSDLEKEVGSTYRITATVSAADDLVEEYIRQNLVWRSSDSNVATVDKEGNVTIVGTGDVEITVSYLGQGKKQTAANTSIKIKGVKKGSGKHPDNNGCNSQNQDPQEQTDNNKSAADPNSPTGGSGIGLPGANVKGGKGTIAGKISGLGAAKKVSAKALANSVFALRLGNVNQSEGLLSNLAGSEKDKDGQGAVQNWRKTEMADTAVPLGRIIEESVPVQTVLFSSLAILLLSIGGRLVEFYLEI